MKAFFVLSYCYFCIKQSSSPKTEKDSKKSIESTEKMMSDLKIKEKDSEKLSTSSHLQCEKRIEIYTLMANAENMLYMGYLKIYKQPQDMHDLFLFDELITIWMQLRAIEKKFPTQNDKKSPKFAKAQEEEHIRQKKFAEKIQKPYPPPSETILSYDLRKSSETLFKYKEEYIEFWGIPNTVNLKERQFFEEYTIENIFHELKNEVKLRAELDSQIPNVNDVKEFAEELKRYSTRYDEECHENDFEGIDLLFKIMYEHIVFIVKNSHSRNFVNFHFCGSAYFDQMMQIACRKAKKAFPLLTLSQFIYIIGRLDM